MLHTLYEMPKQTRGRAGGYGAWGTGAAAMAAEFVASVDLLTPGKNPNSERIPNPRPVIVFYIIALLSISTRKNKQQIATAPPLSHRPCLCFIHFFRWAFHAPHESDTAGSFGSSGNPAERLLPLLTFIFILCTHNQPTTTPSPPPSLHAPTPYCAP